MNIMTKTLVVIGVATTIIAGYSFGFKGDDDKKKKTEKRIEIVEENGQKKVTITTIENGKKKVETFTGSEAEEYLNNNGHSNGNMHMSFNFDFDTTAGRNSFDFSMNGFGEEFAKEMEEMMKELQEEFKTSGETMNLDWNEMLKSLDTVFSDENMKVYSYNFNQGMQQLDSIFKNGGFNFNFQFDDETSEDEANNSNGTSKKKKTIVIARSVVIEDMDKKKGAEKDLQVSDISFYPNPNGGNFSLRYKSQSMDVIDISVTDLQGRNVYNERISATGTVLRNIELDEPSGTYVLTLVQGKNKVSKKLIIQ